MMPASQTVLPAVTVTNKHSNIAFKVSKSLLMENGMISVKLKNGRGI
jgi:hypothetical protein